MRRIALALSAMLIPAGRVALAQDEDSVANTWANFESMPVTPIGLTPDGTKLLAVNLDGGRLSVFTFQNPTLPVLAQEIPVGVDPVSVRARTNDEVWVVNSLSDSISIVSLSQGVVVETLSTGDEPRDVVFAGSPVRAFVTCGTQRKVDVFDPANRQFVTSISVDMWDPHAMAVSADGSRIYAISRISGNGTVCIPDNIVLPTDQQALLFPGAPVTGFITNYSNPAYSTYTGTFTQVDRDLAILNANSLTVQQYVSTVGTVNFHLALRPGADSVFVTNTQALNTTRFEPNLNGHFVDHRITPVTGLSGAPVVGAASDLNPGFNYAGGQSATNISTGVAQPMGIVFNAAGTTAYLAAFGSDRVAELDAATGAVTGRIESRIEFNGATDVSPERMRGPVGLVLDETNNRLYVWNRVSRTISVASTLTKAVLAEVPISRFERIPSEILKGRPHLYNARAGNGISSCAVCHISGRTDGIGWDLGDPNGQPVVVTLRDNSLFTEHPLKGPMVTQSLQGLKDTEPFHWRGDKVDFNAFNPAFQGLLGGVQLPSAQMQDFTNFIETVAYPPNPYRQLNDTVPNTLFGTTSINPAAGELIFNTLPTLGTFTCENCHLNPTGTDTALQLELSSQPMKTAQLRNAYEKGLFVSTASANGTFQTGFGYLHEGLFHGVVDFVNQTFGGVGGTLNPQQVLDVCGFVYCHPTDTAPAVGRTVTLDPVTFADPVRLSTIGTLQAQAIAGKCDLIVKANIGGVERGALFKTVSGFFEPDTIGLPNLTLQDLQVFATFTPMNFIGVAKGTGRRLGIDRDLDTVLNFDDSPASFLSFFGSPTNGCCGTVDTGFLGEPYIGANAVTMSCTGLPALGTAILAMSTTIDPGTPFQGITQYVPLSAPTTILLTKSADLFGTAAHSMAVPDDPALIGVPFHFQWVGFDAAGPQGLTASRRMSVTPYQP